MKHRLQGKKKTLRLRQGLGLRVSLHSLATPSQVAETGPSSRSPIGLLLRRDRLQAMGGGGAYSLPSLGGILVLRVVFCEVLVSCVI